MSELASLDDHALAAELANRAGKLLLELRASSDLTGKALGDAGRCGSKCVADAIAARGAAR